MARLKSFRHHSRLIVDHAGHQGNGHAQQFAGPLGHRSQGQLGHDLTLGLAQVSAQDDGRPLFQGVLDSRDSRLDPIVVCDDPFFERYVEIYPKQEFLSCYVNLINTVHLSISCSLIK